MIGREPRSLSLECAEEVELRQNSDSKRKHTGMKGWKVFFLAKMRCLLEDGIYEAGSRNSYHQLWLVWLIPFLKVVSR